MTIADDSSRQSASVVATFQTRQFYNTDGSDVRIHSSSPYFLIYFVGPTSLDGMIGQKRLVMTGYQYVLDQSLFNCIEVFISMTRHDLVHDASDWTWRQYKTLQTSHVGNIRRFRLVMAPANPFFLLAWEVYMKYSIKHYELKIVKNSNPGSHF